VSIAIVLVAVVIIAGVVVVAMGGGGELSREPADESASGEFRSWADVARYRPPAALLGYHAAATERSLQRIARMMAEQDAEIAWLRTRLAQYEPEGERTDGGQAALAGQDVPPQSVPQHSVPQQSVSLESVSLESGPEESVPQQPVPDESALLDSAPEESTWQRPASPPPSPAGEPVAAEPTSAQPRDLVLEEQDADPSADPMAQASQATGARDDG